MKTLWRPQHFYVVHVDPTNQSLLHRLTESYISPGNYSNVKIMSEICSVRYEWSMVERTLAVLRAGANFSTKWTHAFVISESHYPTMSVETMAAIVSAPENSRTCNFLDPYTYSQEYEVRKRAAYHLGRRCGTGHRAHIWAPHRTMPHACYAAMRGTQVSEWTVLSQPFVRFLLSGHPFIRELIYYSQQYWIPDESFFGDAIVLSSFAETFVNASQAGLTSYVEFPKSNNNGHPILFSEIRDRNVTQFLIQLVASGKYAFARKFGTDDPYTDVIDNALSDLAFI